MEIFSSSVTIKRTREIIWGYQLIMYYLPFFFSKVTDNMQKVCISISPGIPLRGDILIKCYHKKNKAGRREIMRECLHIMYYLPFFCSNVTDNMQKVCISISPRIPLRGDILIKCYHKKNKAGQREIMWGCQLIMYYLPFFLAHLSRRLTR